MALIINQPDVVVFSGTPHGVQLGGVQVRFQDAGSAAFGHAVKLDQTTRPAFENVGLDRCTEGCTGRKFELEAGQVMRVKIGARHQPLVLHRHQHGMRCPMRLCQHEIPCGIKLGHQDDGATKPQRREKYDERGVGVKRRGQHGHRVAAVLVGSTPTHMGPAHAVRLYDALGLAGGA